MSADEQSLGTRGDHPDGSPTIRVLHLDDDESFLDVASTYLERDGDHVEVVGTTDPAEALSLLTGERFDCVVSDYQMSQMDGLEFLEAVRERHPDLPFLLFTGKGSEEIAQRAISAGVTDYIRKKSDPDQFTVLANRIENIVAQHRAERRAREADRRMREVYERITDAVVAFDDEWRYTHANGRAEALLQESEQALLGESLWEVFPAIEETEFGPAFRAAMATQEPRTVEDYFEPLDTWFEVRAYPDEDGLSVYFRDVTERKERERRFDAIFNNTYQFTGLMEPDGTLLEANETALEFGGIEREDVVGERIWDAYWFQTDDQTGERLREDVRRAADGEFVRYELEVRGADGIVTIDFSIRPLRNERGEVELLIPEGRDITRLKERERQLREHERELRKERAFTETIFETLPDVFYAFDTQGNFLRWNDRLSEVTGYTDEEIAEMHPTDFFSGEERERIAGAIAEVVREGEVVTVEADFDSKDGETTPYEFTGAQLRDEDGEVVGLVGVGRDVSQRKERERRFEAIFNNTYQFTGLMEPDGTLLEANETALEFGGIDREEIVGEKIWDAYWFQTDDQTGERLREDVLRAADGEFVRYELEVRGADGIVTIDFSIRPIFGDGEVELLVPEGRDITRLKRREEHLERQNERLEEFASILSHDLQNRLGVARGNVELASEETDLPEIERAREALERMGDLLEDVLELAKLGRIVDDPSPVLARPLLERAVRDVVTEGAEITVECPPDRRVLADPERLSQLVENLVRNAVSHADGTPRVRITLEGDTLAVEDDGPGVPESAREEVFEPGFTTAEDGTGFGLAIVKRVADAHGWSVRLGESDLGGARFEIDGVESA